MKITVDVQKQKLLIVPETLEEAFRLGELWGEQSGLINVSWTGPSNLCFDLRPVQKDKPAS